MDFEAGPGLYFVRIETNTDNNTVIKIIKKTTKTIQY